MADNVQFDTDQQEVFTGKPNSANYAYRGAPGYSQASGMAAWLMRKGYVKTESSARAILFLIILVDFVVAAAVLYFFVFNKA